jgi:integrase
MLKKFQTSYPGVRYYTHATRMINRRPDRYFCIRYRTSDGVRHEDGLGWASKGWTDKKSHEILAVLQANITSGKGPQTLKELRGQLVELQALQVAIAEKDALKRMTFGVLANAFLKAKASKKSIDDDRQRLRDHIRPVLDDVPLEDVHHGHIKTIQDQLEEKKLSPATIKQCLILIRSVFNYARKTPIAPGDTAKIFTGANPFDGYELPRFNNRRETWFSEDDVHRILEAVETEGGDFAWFVKLGMFTGMRRGEIASLVESDVVPATSSIILRSNTEKNEEGRVVYVPSEVMVELKKRLTGKADRPLFQIHPDSVSHKFGRIMDKLGFKSTNRRVSACFHTLRHTLITHLVMAGEPLSMVQDVSGHKTFEMVRRYAKTAAPQARRAVSGFHQKMASPARSEDQTHHHDDEPPATD